MNSKFLIYCNTRQFFTNRWRGEEFHNEIYLSDVDLKRWNITRPQLEAMPEIVKVDDKYNVVGVKDIDISLMKPHGRPLTDLHKFMMKSVCDADLSTGAKITAYWQTFIKHRERFPELFFTADNFSGRVHTPVSGMSKESRPLLLLRGEPVVSFDVAQMQPTLLANVLFDNIGKNEFSETISKGVDVYVMLQKKAGLKTRDEAKKLFFQMIFGRPSNELERLFTGANFMSWINWYKDVTDDRNPHKEKKYSNLAWLLQTYEVSTMTEVWRKLKDNRIPFLTVHDEVICKISDAGRAKTIIESVLSKHFKSYKLNVGHVGASASAEPPQPKPKPKKPLYEIALELIGKHNNKTQSVMIAEMIKLYDLTEAKAMAGLKQLIDGRVIELTTVQTGVNRYYMTDSMPF